MGGDISTFPWVECRVAESVHESCRYLHANGNIYNGEMANNKKHGRGRYGVVSLRETAAPVVAFSLADAEQPFPNRAGTSGRVAMSTKGIGSRVPCTARVTVCSRVALCAT